MLCTQLSNPRNDEDVQKIISIKEVEMKFTQKSLIGIAAIMALTLIGSIALIRNTDTKVNLDLGSRGSLTIESKQSPSLAEETQVDCLPGEENSQPKNCNS